MKSADGVLFVFLKIVDMDIITSERGSYSYIIHLGRNQMISKKPSK